MGKKPRQWSPDGLKYLMIINPFGWRNPPNGSSRNVIPGRLIAWVNHALGYQGDSAVQELAWRAKTGATEAILLGIGESVDIKGLLGEHRWSDFSMARPDSSYIFETNYESLAHACGADSWKRVESDLQPEVVQDMFKKPYPRPYWADSRKQCAGMNAQVSIRVKTMQALPQPELQDFKPEPSVSQPPLVVTSDFGPSESENILHRPSRPAYTGSMPPTLAQTPQVTPRGYPGAQGASSQEFSNVKQEPPEGSAHSSINPPRSISVPPNTLSTQVLVSIEPEQSGNQSHSNAPRNEHQHGAFSRRDATADVPELRVKVEVPEGPVASVGRTTAAYGAFLAARRSAALASIPLIPATSPFPGSRSAQAQPGNAPFSPDVPPPSSTLETPTTHVKTEPLGHTFQSAQPANTNPLESEVSVDLSSSGVSLPATDFEPTATFTPPSIVRSEPLSTQERTSRFPVKAEPNLPLTNLAPSVARSGTSPLTNRHSQLQGTPVNVNVTASPNPRQVSGIDEQSTICGPSGSSSALNKRKSTSTSTDDRDRKRTRLDDSSC